MRYILAATEDRAAVEVVRSAFRRSSHVDEAFSVQRGIDLFRKRRYEFIFVDLDLIDERQGGSGDAFRLLRQAFPSAEIIVMTPPERIREAVEAVKAGAANYVTHPLNADEVRYVVESIHEGIRAQSELDYLRDRFWQSDSLEVVQTRNPAMRAVFEQVRLVAPTKSTVLLSGETGTGKGVLAKLIHRHSNRREVQFIGIHCGAIPDTLLESELFGHEKGAFTGAVRRKLGKFELANGGTIFLDEIGTITPAAQIKLLQVLQDRTFQRVGGEALIETDVRIIAASNSDLERDGGEGPLPERPLLPPERLSHHDPAASGTPGGHPPADGDLPQADEPFQPPGDPLCPPPGHGGLSALSLAREHPRAAEPRRAGLYPGDLLHPDAGEFPGRALCRRAGGRADARGNAALRWRMSAAGPLQRRRSDTSGRSSPGTAGGSTGRRRPPASRSVRSTN